MVDLAGDISPLLELDSDTLRERLYTAKADLGDNAAVPVKLVHINKCPVLAQANTLRPEDADRLGINRQHCLDNLKILRENPQVREKVVAIFAEAEPFTPSENVDAQLYNGFFSDADRAAMKIVLETEPRNLRHWISLLLINELKNCCSIIEHATSRGRWIMPSSNAGWSTAARSSRQSFCRATLMNCRCWHNSMPMTKRKWRC